MRAGAVFREGSALPRLLRLTNVRIISQTVFGLLFVFLFGVTWLGRLGGYPISLFLELDPLVSVATALSTGTVYRNLAWGLWVLIPTLFLGRAFCGWVCPFGSLHHFWGWLFDTRRFHDDVSVNRYRTWYRLKYILLVALLCAAALGALQTGLIDPLALLARSTAAAVAPAWDALVTALGEAFAARGWPSAWTQMVAFKPGVEQLREQQGAWLVGAILLALVGLNLVVPRFFCRALCPLGALLGVLSRFSLLRIDRDLGRCTDCNFCLRHCPGACDPQGALRRSECFVCFNCLDDCPEEALAFRFLPGAPRVSAPFGAPAGTPGVVRSQVAGGEVVWPDLGRRRLLLAGLTGLLAAPLLRLSGSVNDRVFSPRAIRPPGSLAEPQFLARCIKCGQCASVCPTNVIQPAGLAEAGIEGLWAPVLNMRAGYCQLDCVLCGQVCPTGAIAALTPARKRGLGPHAADGPVRVGTAFLAQGRCLPWSMETPCVVCQEVCPTSPKAIGVYDEQIRRWDHAVVVVNKPYVRPELCIGCGICEYSCPVAGGPAIYVQATGETRSRARSLLLGLETGRGKTA